MRGLSPLFPLALVVLAVVSIPFFVKLAGPDYYTQTVVVATPNKNKYGTGWWVNGDGYIVTAFHVVEAAPEETILVLRGSWNATARLVAYDQRLDIAVLRVEEPPGWARGLPLNYKIYLGQRVLVVGYPVQLYAESYKSYTLMSLSPRVAEGIISWLHPTEPLASFTAQTDAGNSGGPVLDADSKGVVGIVVYARTGVVSTDFYMLRADAIARFLDEHGIDYSVAGEGARHAALGIAVAAVLATGLVAARRGW